MQHRWSCLGDGLCMDWDAAVAQGDTRRACGGNRRSGEVNGVLVQSIKDSTDSTVAHVHNTER